MKKYYFLFRWEIRDGDNEYDEQAIIETTSNDEKYWKKLFKRTLELMYSNSPKQFESDDTTYEFSYDYRLFTYRTYFLITSEQVNFLEKVGLAYRV